jgi:hypothetical protein
VCVSVCECVRLCECVSVCECDIETSKMKLPWPEVFLLHQMNK